jgi:pimeloyl-ACP methyl ester carboxylesterase
VEGGAGSTALVFTTAGWRCVGVGPTMRRFAPHYRVVALDLAGHGASSRDRTQWTVENFGADVAAVVRTLQLQHVVLIGHSMSGPICVAAVDQLGPTVEALIPVDTMLNVEWDMPPEAWAGFFDGLRKDFPAAVESFFRGFLAAKTSPKDGSTASSPGASCGSESRCRCQRARSST